MNKKVIIIGAGLGGLSAAIRLAVEGFSVTILEKNATIGGKVNIVERDGYRFDTGASFLTMKHVVEELFTFAGRNINDYLEIVPLEPICRYFWNDGTVFDASTDLAKTAAGIQQFEDAGGFRRFLEDSRRKYEVSERTFLSHSLNDLPKLLRPRYLKDIFAISSTKTLDKHVGSYFKSAKMRQLFNRFATYNGSSPYQTPATFALIPYVEFGLGAWYVKGGMYQIPLALGKLARELGVEIRTECEVKRIITSNGTATGVELSDSVMEADFVVTNADAVTTYRELLDIQNKRIENLEPSCSGFVLLLGTKKRFPRLAHHNIFFSNDYKAEFDALFRKKRPAAEPTIYVCATSTSDSTQSPEGHENLFILVNAPYTSGETDWEVEARPYRDLIIKMLQRFGLEGLEESIDFEEWITPEDFNEKYRANRGSIYGLSSNGIFSAFMRPPNRTSQVKNLFFVGGATHPGGGIPLVLISGKLASELVSAANSSVSSEIV
jgi:phytoene desaturase